MKNLVKICAMTAMLVLSTVPAMAEQAAAPPAAAAPNDAGGMMMCRKMQKDMASMMQDMDGMIKSTSDAAMKERMQKMHDQMGAMMSDMQKMHEGMGGMMGRGMQGKAPASAPSAATPAEDDHKTHHPEGEQK